MGVPWKKIFGGIGKAETVLKIGGAFVPGLGVASDIVGRIVGATHAVEAIPAALSGPQKEDAAIAAWKAVEEITGRDFADDARVETTARKVMQAYVASMNAQAAVLDAVEELKALVDDIKSRTA